MGDARISHVLEFLHDNHQLPLTLTQMAAQAGLSSYHFLRVFKAATGLPPRRYLLRLRVAAARRHLDLGDLPITEIAFLCGFSSGPHLADAFRREVGVAPSAYRQQRAG